MKKLIVFVLVLVCLFSMVACDRTPASEVFDATVSYAGWCDLSELPAKALNVDKMAFNSVKHFPIYKFDTLTELQQFKNDVKGILSTDYRYAGYPSLSDATAGCDESFFNENTLMLVYVAAPSGSFRYGVDSIYHADGNFCVHIKNTNEPGGGGTCDVSGWFVTVAVSDDLIADCTAFDADFSGNWLYQ